MTSTQVQAQNQTQPVIIARLDMLSKQLSELDEKIDALTGEQSKFMVTYTKAHSELEAEVKRIDEKSTRAHERIDAITRIVWTLALPVILGSLALMWGILTHTVVIGGL